MIWAVLLAAGESKRMGRSKLLLPLGTLTIFENTLDGLRQSGVDRILVVLGAFQNRIKPLISGSETESVFNTEYKNGMLSSIQAGIRQLPKEARAALIVLGDQPSTPPRVVNSVIAEFHRTGKGIVIPVVEGRRGHPILIDLKYREEIAGLSPEIGLRELVHSHQEDIQEVNLKIPEVLQDIDTPEDYRNALESMDPDLDLPD